jgi:hypothetical protein
VTSRPPLGGTTKEVSTRCYSSASTEVELRNTVEGEEASYDLTLVPLDPGNAPGNNVPAWLIAQVSSTRLPKTSAWESSTRWEARVGLLPTPSPPCSLRSQISAAHPSIYLQQNLDESSGGSPSNASSLAVASTEAAAGAAAPTSAFWLRVHSLTLRPGGTRKIPIVFSPMSPGQHRCAIVAVERGRRSEVVRSTVRAV